MKKNKVILFLSLLVLTLAGVSARAQVDGRASPEAMRARSAYSGGVVNRILDQDMNSRRKIYDSLDQKTVLKVDLKGAATGNIQDKVDEVLGKQKDIPNQFEVAISNAKTEHDENVVIDYIRKAAAERKAKIEAEAEQKRKAGLGLSTVGSESVPGKNEKIDTKGRFNITGGLGGGGNITFKFTKRF